MNCLMKNNISFNNTWVFEKELKRLQKKYPSIRTDLLSLIEKIRLNPIQGVDMGHNIRKIRLSITSKGKGKSGGARVITFNLLTNVLNQKVVFVSIYDKSEKSNLTVSFIISVLKNEGFIK